MAWRAVVSMQYAVLHPARTSRVRPALVERLLKRGPEERARAALRNHGFVGTRRDAWMEMDGMGCGITGPHVLILHEDDRDAGAPCVGEEGLQGVEEGRAVSGRGVGVFDKAYLCVDDDDESL
jgi:hypothetical protein